MAGRGQRRRRAAARSVDRVQVDVVRILVVGVVVEVELHLVALADADELAGHMTAEGPEGVAHAVGEPSFDFLDLEMHDDLGRVVTGYRRRDVRGVGQDRVLFADDRVGQVLFARGGIGADGEHRREGYA